MRRADWFFVAGMALFVGGAVLVLWSTASGSRPLLGLGLAGLGAAVVCLLVGAWHRLTRVDWDRIAAEQRLWRSGPLGRAWLKVRKSLFR